jgi:hypothetical protein
MSKKKKRKQSKIESSHPESLGNAFLTGEIPWTQEGLEEALAHIAKLHNTPRDDWDRRKKGITLIDDDGSLSRITFNPDMMPNQIMDFIIARGRERGESQEKIMSHSWRFMEIMGFLRDNDSRLREEKLVMDDPTDPAASMISGSLLRILATARYEGVALQGPNRDPVRSFHTDRVITEARRLAESDEEDSKDS